jgi:hypothetical protein
VTVEVALRLLQLLADPSAELERADRPGGLGQARMRLLLHNTVFKVRRQLALASCLLLGSRPVAAAPVVPQHGLQACCGIPRCPWKNYACAVV